MVRVTIVSDPPGALVVAPPGRVLGKTPIETEWRRRSGKKRVTVRLAGHYPGVVEFGTHKDREMRVRLMRFHTGPASAKPKPTEDDDDLPIPK